jgi:hypothetical protein
MLERCVPGTLEACVPGRMIEEGNAGSVRTQGMIEEGTLEACVPSIGRTNEDLL